MPPRTQPKIYLLQLSIHLTVLPTTTLAELKQEVFDAFTSDVAEPMTRLAGEPKPKDPDGMDEDMDISSYDTSGLPPAPEDVVPRVASLEDFELCRAVKEKGRMTGEFHVVEANDVELKLSGLSGWEVLFVQFRDKKSGLLMPAKFTLPPIDDDEEEVTPLVEAEPSSASLGKRKARAETED
ncbi:hypothetical protein P691DRAFT_798516 [Macrolepiota fuliginosa MF-IS2]|uniref:Uncharacterized protein n=1 Tax=Macrolepiota fuliginosa MF-IS2 TaxID=1400762 RepID=A0A9P6C6G3_9AGAR|nr:hypothetical protein P691DRAFT_798516 [Macrolepiota fuliginosa MF-IS2]